LCSEESTEVDPDDTPIGEIKASLRRALQEAKSGQRIPISQMWESIESYNRSNRTKSIEIESSFSSLKSILSNELSLWEMPTLQNY
jgi:hypothetical protein